MSFARKRFNALFACQAVVGLVALVVYASIVDSIIVGNLVGVEALAGVAAVLPFAAVLLFLSSHYLVLDRIRLSLVTTVLSGLLLTAGCTASLCFICGLDAMWLGFPLGALLTLVALAVYCRVSTRRYSLLLLPKGTSAVFNHSFIPESRHPLVEVSLVVDESSATLVPMKAAAI